MTPWHWTWRDAVRLWIYNWIKRPWRNFLWRYGPTGAQAHRQFPDLPRGYPQLARMDRSDIEWARAAFERLDQTDEFKEFPARLRAAEPGAGRGVNP